MAEAFLRKDLAVGEGAPAEAPASLLAWASELAERAPEQDVYRNKEGRKTLRFDWQQRSWFLKIHNGIGWSEIFKNLLQGRLPVLGASNEYRAVLALEALGVDTMSVGAYASSGANPARLKSMIGGSGVSFCKSTFF